MAPSLRHLENDLKKAATRKRLVDAAVELMTEGGFSTLSAAEVAKRAGLAAGAYRRHFADIFECFAEAYAVAADKEYQLVQKVILGPGDAQSRLFRALELIGTRALANRHLAYALANEPLPGEVQLTRMQYQNAYVILFEELIEQGIRSGEFDHQVSYISAVIIVSTIRATLLDHFSVPHLHERLEPMRLISAVQGACLGLVKYPL